MVNKEKIYLTFDMEWGNDTVLEYFYGLLKKHDVEATIFVTHKTKWLDEFRKDPKIELGIHPNFNNILSGGVKRTGNYKKIIDELMELVPEAVSYRSHALTDSSLIISYCVEKGLKNNLNIYYFPEQGVNVKPYKQSGIIRIPFIFEDDIWLLDDERKETGYYLDDKFKMYRIFNFHPIHLYLNCENYDRYEKAKPYNHEPAQLSLYRNKVEWGMENVFQKIIETARDKGYGFGLIKEIGESIK